MGIENLRDKGLTVLAALVPVAELYIVRSVHRPKIDLYTQSNFMIGLCVAFFTLFVFYHGLSSLRLQKKALRANIAFLLVAVSAKLIFIHTEWIGFLWLCVVGSALLLFVEPRRLLRHFQANLPIFYFALPVYAALLVYHLMRYVKWFNKEVWFGFLAGYVAGTVRFFLDLFNYEMLPVGGPHIIRHPDLRIWINAACSGMEGVVFFVAIFSCMMMLDYKFIPYKRIIKGYLIGILMMLTLNIIRITVFFMFGVWAVQKWGSEEGIKLTVDLFHNNIGWILYTLGMVAFFMFFYKSTAKNPDRRSG